jgi:small GTP-binding protein
MRSYRFKIILAGDESVGKTSTILRFIQNTFSEMYKPTLGFQISVKNMKYISPANEEISVVLSLWDVAGQGQFAVVRKGYYQGTDGVLLLFDLTRRKTFDNAKAWADEIRAVMPAVPFLLVGNKADLPNHVVLSEECARASTEQNFVGYAIVSAATGRGVDDIFKGIANCIIDKITPSTGGAPERQVEPKAAVKYLPPAFSPLPPAPPTVRIISPSPPLSPEIPRGKTESQDLVTQPPTGTRDESLESKPKKRELWKKLLPGTNPTSS